MTSYPPLYILRHGETVWNAENRLQGHFDSPLTARGRAQAEAQNAILRARDLTGFTALRMAFGASACARPRAVSGESNGP